MKETISSRLLGQIHYPFAFDVMHGGLKLDSFTTVTIDDVMKLLNMMYAKSYTMDFVPTSVLKKYSGMFAPCIDLPICRLTRANFHLSSSKLKSLLS